MPDALKIRETVNDIREHLYAWSQANWARSDLGYDDIGRLTLTFSGITPDCGTTLCGAGFRCLRDGLTLAFDTHWGDWVFLDSAGRAHDPADWAAESMGLDEHKAYLMFLQSARITDVNVYAELAEAIIAGDLERAESLCLAGPGYQARLDLTHQSEPAASA